MLASAGSSSDLTDLGDYRVIASDLDSWYSSMYPPITWYIGALGAGWVPNSKTVSRGGFFRKLNPQVLRRQPRASHRTTQHGVGLQSAGLQVVEPESVQGRTKPVREDVHGQPAQHQCVPQDCPRRCCLSTSEWHPHALGLGCQRRGAPIDGSWGMHCPASAFNMRVRIASQFSHEGHSWYDGSPPVVGAEAAKYPSYGYQHRQFVRASA